MLSVTAASQLQDAAEQIAILDDDRDLALTCGLFCGAFSLVGRIIFNCGSKPAYYHFCGRIPPLNAML